MSYTACDVNDCKNYGDVHLHATGYKDEKNPTLTRPAIGGIAGYLNGDVTGCENHGHVLLQGTNGAWFGKTEVDPNTAGIGKMTRPVIGGVCGSLGFPSGTYITTDKDTIVIKVKPRIINNCQNYGKVELENPASMVYVPIGGVVGFPTGTVSNCTNHGYIHVINGGRQTYLGGVVGCVLEPSNTFENCINYGEIYFEKSNVEALNQKTIRSYIGGVMGGYNTTGQDNSVTGCENHGYVHSDAKAVTVVGGVFGSLHGTITNCINRGSVTMQSATYTVDTDNNIYASEIGGIVGYTNCKTDITVLMDGCANYGTLTNNSASGTDTGGLIGAIGGGRYIQNSIVDCTISSATDTNAGFVIGSTRDVKAAVKLGDTDAPITIQNTTTLNGTKVKAADIDIPKNGGKLAGILRNKATITINNVVIGEKPLQ